ncbi:hypothetical protein CYMTET_31798, partial [Cymbomonas tetramitiformis]
MSEHDKTKGLSDTKHEATVEVDSTRTSLVGEEEVIKLSEGAEAEIPERGFAPDVQWDKTVWGYFSSVYGEEKLREISRSLTRPPAHSCFRVNTTFLDPASAAANLEEHLAQATPMGATSAFSIERKFDTLLVRGKGQQVVDYMQAGTRE